MLFLIILSLYYCLNIDRNEIDLIVTDKTNWKIKERELNSRLHSSPILLYHNIDGKGEFSISLNVLRSHFQLLRDMNIRIISLTKLIQKLTNPHPFNEKVIAITFDDGFLSMYSKLMPLVKEFHYPVTLFVYTNFIYTNSKRNLTWEKLREIGESGIEIECHSISHSDLLILSEKNTIDSRRKLFKEIYLSKRMIELYLKKKIKFFTFPYGRYNLKLIELCQYSGYQRVFSTDYGSNIITRNNFCLKRSHIKKKHSIKYLKKLIK